MKVLVFVKVIVYSELVPMQPRFNSKFAKQSIGGKKGENTKTKTLKQVGDIYDKLVIWIYNK